MMERCADAMLLMLLLALQPALPAPAPGSCGPSPVGSPSSALREPCLLLAACRGGRGEAPDEYATAEDRMGGASASSAVTRDPDDDDLIRYASGSARGATLHEPAGESEDDESSESWTVQEHGTVRKRRQEEENAVKEFGGDLSALGSGARGLKAQEWDASAAANEHVQFISHAEKKALEEEALIAAAGGGLGACFAEARPSGFERDKREWEASGAGSRDFISVKERKKQEEDALLQSFGGDLSAMSARDKTHLRKQSWERADSTADIQVISAAERRRREEEEALRTFGGGLENCVRHETAIEREQREFKLRGKVKRRKKPT